MKITFEAQGADISFIAVYAPHSLHETETKESFYDALSDEISRTKGIYYIGGDFNARIHHVREVDKEVCGPYILGRGLEYLNVMNESTKESRSLFLGFAKIHNLKVMNSMFSKPAEKLLTYRCKIPSEGFDEQEAGPPYGAVKYAQIDFWLAGSNWRKTLLDTQSRKDIFFETDHFVLEAKITVCSFTCRPNDKDIVRRYQKPDPNNWRKYNEHIRNYLFAHPLTYQNLTTALREAAERHLEQIPPGTKKTYLSRQTWNKIDRRNQTRQIGGTVNEIKQMNKDIAKAAKIDKQRSLIEKFVDNPHDKNKKHMWKAVKDLKKKFCPQFVKMKNKNGIHVPLIKRAETIAEYLETEHWKNESQHDGPSRERILQTNSAILTQFSLQELKCALKTTKANKQPGPDGIVMELFKWLDTPNQDTLLSLINDWWVPERRLKSCFLLE